MIKRTILVVDDEQPVRRVLSRILERAGFEAVSTDCTASADKILAERHVDAVLCDHVLPGETGLAYLERLQRSHPSLVRVLVTGFGDLQMAMNAINKAKVQHFLAKPFEPEEVLACLVSLQSMPAAPMPKAPGAAHRPGGTALRQLRDRYPGIDVVQRNTQGIILLEETPAPRGDTVQEPSVPKARVPGSGTPQAEARKRPEPGNGARRQPTALRELEAAHPGISAIERTATGSIMLDEEAYEQMLDTGVYKRPAAGLSTRPKKRPEPQDPAKPLGEHWAQDPPSPPSEAKDKRQSDSGPFDVDIVFDESLMKLIG